MSTLPDKPGSCAAYNRRIDDIMPLERWKAIKGGFFAVITIAFAVFVILMEGDETAVFLGTVILLLVYYGVELHEVELVKGVSITFKNGHSNPDSDDQPDDED